MRCSALGTQTEMSVLRKKVWLLVFSPILSILRDKKRKVIEIYPAEILQTADMRKAIRKSASPTFRNRSMNHRSTAS